MSATSAAMLSEEQLDTDVQRAISGAEEMLQQAAATGGEKGVELRSRALQQLRALRERLQVAQSAVVERGKLALPLARKNRWTIFSVPLIVRDGRTKPDQTHVSNS